MKREPVDIGGALHSAFTGPVEEDTAPVNVLAGALAAQGRDAEKGSLEDAPNLIALREAVAGLRSGSLTAEDYYVSVSQVHQQIYELLGLFEMQQVQRDLALGDEREQDMAENARHGLEMIEHGIGRLVNYLDSQESQDLEEGMAQVEAGYLRLDQAQDEALQMLEESDEGDSEGPDHE